MAEPDAPRDDTQALQAAALQLIAAARSFLDVTERLVRDPQAVQQVAGTVAGLGKVAVEVLRSRGSAAADPAPGAHPARPAERIALADDEPPPAPDPPPRGPSTRAG